MGKLIERLSINTITHAFVCSAHAESVGFVCHLQTHVKEMITFTAAVECLLTDVLLRTGCARGRQEGGGYVPTQHWETFVTEVVGLVLQNRKKINFSRNRSDIS